MSYAYNGWTDNCKPSYNTIHSWFYIKINNFEEFIGIHVHIYKTPSVVAKSVHMYSVQDSKNISKILMFVYLITCHFAKVKCFVTVKWFVGTDMIEGFIFADQP